VTHKNYASSSNEKQRKQEERKGTLWWWLIEVLQLLEIRAMEVVLLPLVSPGFTVNHEASDTDSVVEQDDLESAVYTEDDWKDTTSGSVGADSSFDIKLRDDCDRSQKDDARLSGGGMLVGSDRVLRITGAACTRRHLSFSYFDMNFHRCSSSVTMML
jgi:hypothetical protein